MNASLVWFDWSLMWRAARVASSKQCRCHGTWKDGGVEFFLALWIEQHALFFPAAPHRSSWEALVTVGAVVMTSCQPCLEKIIWNIQQKCVCVPERLTLKWKCNSKNFFFTVLNVFLLISSPSCFCFFPQLFFILTYGSAVWKMVQVQPSFGFVQSLSQ